MASSPTDPSPRLIAQPLPKVQKTLVLGLCLSTFFILALTGYFLGQSREILQDKAANNADSLTRIIARYAYTELHETDVFLLRWSDRHDRTMVESAADAPSFAAALSADLRRYPSILNVRLADANGNIEFASDGGVTGRPINIADRTYFAEARESDRLIISKPVVGRLSGKWVIPLVRRLSDAHGKFAGVIEANLDAKDFTGLFATIKAGPKNTFLFFDPGTSINLRYPEPKGPGRAINLKIGSPEFKALWWKQGIHAATYRAQSTTDGIRRIYSYRQVGDYPYYVMAGVAEDDVMAPWRFQAAVAGGFVGAFLLLVAYVFRSQLREVSERRTTEVARREIEERYQKTFQTIPDAITINRITDGVYLDVNQAFVERTGYERSEAIGRSTHELDMWVDATARDQFIKTIVEQKYVRNFEARFRKKSGEITWGLMSASLVDLNGEPCTLSVTSDINEQKAAEQRSRLRLKLADMVYTHDTQDLLRATVETAEEITESRIGFFHFVEKDQETISPQIRSARPTGETEQARSLALQAAIGEADIVADCVRLRKAVMCNAHQNAARGEGLPQEEAESIRELVVPVFREQRIVAVLGVGDKRRDYNDHELEQVSRLADIAYDFVERKRAEQQIQFMAFNDVLTGLPNRQLFADRLQQAISLAKRSSMLLAICYLDLDGFKPVNDRYGHEVGDRLLVRLSERLRELLREGDTIARLGGDEFVILLNQLANIFHGEDAVQRLLDAIAQPFEIEDHRIHISGSIGVTFFPHDESDPDALLRHADQAMYKAKLSGKNSFRLYDPIQDQKAHATRKALSEFEDALHQTQLILHYQPRIDLRTGAIAGVEALVRWNHPERGLLVPAEFLPLIDDSPLEIALDEWVLKAALAQHLAWREQGLVLPVSVNISPRNIQQAGFPEYLAKLLANFPEGVSSFLELEVLETSAIGDTARVAEIMNACAELGVTFSLDDFGTGYSSLTYFHRLPISVLKIDQHFVRSMMLDARDQDIVEGVVKLAEALNRPVVAEGVENLELGIMLDALGCQFGQGYGIARPMPADAIVDWSRRWRDEETWHRLHQLAKGPTDRYDLNVAIFTHRQWADRVKSYLASGLTAECPELDETSCQFSIWHHGIGRARYGGCQMFAQVIARHEAVHRVAQELVEVAGSQGTNAALSRMDELMVNCEELVAGLIELSPPVH